MDTDSNSKKKIVSSLMWAFLERCGAQGIGLVVNIILARLLTPDDYGILAIITIFTNISAQFVQNGFGVALIQNSSVSEEDYSSVFHVGLGITAALYGVIWIFAPQIGVFYETDALVWPLRVLSITLFLGTVQSVQTAKLRREMDFKSLMFLTLIASSCGGAVGILLAWLQAGVWALVFQQLMASIATCAALFLRYRWIPKMKISWRRVRILFSFGWRILASGLMETLYTNLNGLIIGKKYSPSMLGYYDKGSMLPNQVISNINSSIQNVMLSALSRQQGDLERCKQMVRRAMQLSCFLIFPMMAGLAATAETVVAILLTEVWLPCVPFMQLSCLIYATIPISTTNLQIIKAMGRSDIYLKLEIIKKVIGLVILIITVVCFDSVFAIMLGTAITMPIGVLINASPNKQLIGYSFKEQFIDLMPPMLLSVAMFIVVYGIKWFSISLWPKLTLQVLTGVVFYVAMAAIFRLESFIYVWNQIKTHVMRNKTR